MTPARWLRKLARRVHVDDWVRIDVEIAISLIRLDFDCVARQPLSTLRLKVARSNIGPQGGVAIVACDPLIPVCVGRTPADRQFLAERFVAIVVGDRTGGRYENSGIPLWIKAVESA